ncbi:TetR family transcriptional regulator [Nesterenkonia sp. E16_7]|uniref:TetR family transcriptional regulator n=1 Tax=unclassified Nesterenkonia TaxID=2629769 RepID=UPI001A917624|nr:MULTISPECIES: TetR family transcriptional regulator [unclassified Nesterenkonia]MBO0596249.1 TetR family transcriptional regulator [Nesterenkonia sp. E16_10]MBO0597156.1 TetR family transcriptional regulator [Nesterenkonia sp. E16_7]
MAAQNSTVHISIPAIVGVATEILEQYGLADLSMRRVATQLGVQPSALYWHVKDKQSLLALVADRLLDSVRLDASLSDWRSELRTRAVTLHAALLSTRDAAELVASVVALGTGGHRLRTIIAGASSHLPPMMEGANTIAEPELLPGPLVDAVCSLLLGSALITQQRAQAAEFGVVTTDSPPLSDFPAMLDLLLDA